MSLFTTVSMCALLTLSIVGQIAMCQLPCSPLIRMLKYCVFTLMVPQLLPMKSCHKEYQCVINKGSTESKCSSFISFQNVWNAHIYYVKPHYYPVLNYDIMSGHALGTPGSTSMLAILRTCGTRKPIKQCPSTQECGRWARAQCWMQADLPMPDDR